MNYLHQEKCLRSQGPVAELFLPVNPLEVLSPLGPRLGGVGDLPLGGVGNGRGLEERMRFLLHFAPLP
jgi:hypothetical protein